MAPKVEAPKPSAEEKALQAQQAALLKQQAAIINKGYQQQQKMMPFFAKQAGFTLKYDKKGNIIGADPIVDPLAEQNKEIQAKLNQRTLDALNGNLPVDPALERDLQKQETTLRERLGSQFGPGYETSTPGSDTLGEFFKTSEGLRSAARTGQLTLSEQLGLSRSEADRAGQAQSLNIMRGSTIGDPLSFATGNAQAAQGFGQAQVPYIQQRQMELNASVQNAQNSMSIFGGIGNILGMGFGALFG